MADEIVRSSNQDDLPGDWELGSEAGQKCESIELLLSDVDGVLTDGRLIYGSDGAEIKEFHVRDGLAVKLWKNCGYQFGLITARESPMVERRARELGVDFLLQSRPGKLKAVEEIATQTGVELNRIAYVGDDLHDLSAVRQVGLGITVSDAATEVKNVADVVTRQGGGQGALREIVELVLKAKGQWDQAIEMFSE